VGPCCLELGHGWRVPLASRQALLDKSAVDLGRGWRLALVPAGVAQPAGSGDVACRIFPAILLRHQVFGGAAQRRGRAGAQAEGFQFVGGAVPHRQAAVAAAAGLSVEGEGAQALEVGHCSPRAVQGFARRLFRVRTGTCCHGHCTGTTPEPSGHAAWPLSGQHGSGVKIGQTGWPSSGKHSCGF